MNNRAKICIVDDNAPAREAGAELLSTEPYDVVPLTSGLELLAQLNQIMPDVILLDVMMPEMNGFEVCRRLKAEAAWQHIPVILVTALDSRADLVRGLEAGADEFLTKPVNGPELRARVHSMLRIKRQYDRLQEMLELRQNLANMIVHDMRTPLTTAQLKVDLMLHIGSLSPEDHAGLKTVLDQLRRLNAFMNEILLVAKMEQGRLLLNRSAQSLNTLVLETVQSFEIMAQSRKVDLIPELPPESPVVSLDAGLFGRVLDNLISNALKFSPQGGTVTLRVKPESGSGGVCLQVLDEGPGVPETHRESIFNMYEIVKLKAAGAMQTGLGLAFCKMVVDAHGGKIFVEPNSPVGSIFTVELL
jgi:signal transduction histidine kinase